MPASTASCTVAAPSSRVVGPQPWPVPLPPRVQALLSPSLPKVLCCIGVSLYHPFAFLRYKKAPSLTRASVVVLTYAVNSSVTLARALLLGSYWIPGSWNGRWGTLILRFAQIWVVSLSCYDALHLELYKNRLFSGC